MDGIEDRWVVVERPFRSDKLLIGGIIVWFRQLWNSVATQWYVRPLLEQQNEINRQLILELARVREEASVEQTIASALDQEQADLRRQATGALLALTEELHELRQRVEQLEQRLSGPGDGT